MLNDATIQEMLKDRIDDEDGIGLYVYALVMASAGKVAMLGSFSAFANKYYIVSFTKDTIHMLHLDLSGKVKHYGYLPLSEVVSIKVRPWFFGMGKRITIVDKNKSKIKFKVNKFTAGLKHQKSNLSAIADRFAN